MAQPASGPFPSSDNTILIIRELKIHVETFSEHLKKMLENHSFVIQGTFLREFSQNIAALSNLLKPLASHSMDPDLKAFLEEIFDILNRVLNLPIDTDKGAQITLVNAIKNHTTPSTRESDLSCFLSLLIKYPEAVQVLIQELSLLSKDLGKHI